MSQVFIIYPLEDAGGTALWGLFTDGRLAEAGRSPIADCSVHAGGAEVWMVVPGMDVTVRPVEMPAKTAGKARVMLPFLMEDDIGTPVGDVHFALGAMDGSPLGGAIARQRMDGWLGDLAAAGLSPARMVPDYLSLPRAEGIRTATVGDRIVVRLADGCGFTMEAETAKFLLAARGEAVTCGQPLPDAQFLDLLYAGAVDAPINLLQGRYAPKRSFDLDFSVWRRTAAIGALAAASYLVVMVSSTWWYDREAARLDRQAESVLLEVFPDIGRVVNPRAQMKSRLDALRANASDRFLHLSRMLAGGVETVDGVQIRSLRYDEAQGTLSAEMAYAEFEDMEAVKAAVSRRGGRLEEGSSRNSGDGMLGDVKVRMP